MFGEVSKAKRYVLDTLYMFVKAQWGIVLASTQSAKTYGLRVVAWIILVWIARKREAATTLWTKSRSKTSTKRIGTTNRPDSDHSCLK